MKISLKMFLPMLSDAIGANAIELEFPGKTAGELVDHIAKTFGKRAADALYDKTGVLDLEVQLLINRKTWVTRENLDERLEDGDRVQIMVMMGGG
jgi:molybdopterin converting factor small subunit